MNTDYCVFIIDLSIVCIIKQVYVYTDFVCSYVYILLYDYILDIKYNRVALFVPIKSASKKENIFKVCRHIQTEELSF